MTTTTAIGATAASHVALKLAAGGLAAALTVGGAAAVTGNLPDGAQTFAADAAAHIGLDLPRPDASLDGSLDLSLGDIVTVGGAGRLGVTLDGDTLLTALLLAGRRIRESEFGDGPRAGFCLMGACQDCWVTLAGGGRVRACSTYVRDGLAVLTGGTPEG